MARGDIKIVDVGGKNVVASRRFRTQSGSTNILAGEPVSLGAAGSNYAIQMATDAYPTTTAGQRMLGIAASDSTHTASADGVVDVYLVEPGITVMRAKATTSVNVDTDAELLAILNDRVAFDHALAADPFTIDENQGDAATNGLRIIDGDIAEGTLDFVLQAGASDIQ